VILNDEFSNKKNTIIIPETQQQKRDE